MTAPGFDWTEQHDAETLLEEIIDGALSSSSALAHLDARLRTRTSTRLMNWLDHVVVPVSTGRLESVGYQRGFRTTGDVWRHPGAQLPAVVPDDSHTFALRVDDAVAFANAQGSTSGVVGSPLGGYRVANVSDENGLVIAGIERRSWSRGIHPQTFSDAETIAAAKAWQLWDERPRTRTTGGEAVAATIDVARRMVELVGVDLAAAYVLDIERRYWQRRNTAANVQHARQDRLGLGWGNNDHHTFRSSRPGFKPLMQLFDQLGFLSRERFYAGEQAGWGAQVLEHPGCGGVLFTDVDLKPDELDIDFSTTMLDEADRLGTVGMWCALHGESILAAGMHHLEGQFEFDALRDDLAALDIGQMKPFSDFPHLRQAFTNGERWPVPKETLDSLLASGEIDQTKVDEFVAHGAVGSHLENLQRRGGFKGFNQRSVSATMAVTDPRVYRD